jgi:uncharacterized protein YqjF (DUF2071 family)
MRKPGERPVLLADWTDVLMVHFAADPKALQPHVPFELDLFRARAYVSLVAFTQRRLRPRFGGRLAAVASTPLAEHEFLNVRTYVRHGGERGIYFLAEWIPNRLACALGPRMYGLPYRLSRCEYRCRTAPVRRGHYSVRVTSRDGALAWAARLRPTADARGARRGLEHFLLERYTAFTRRGTTGLRFRVWHEPWRLTGARVVLRDTGLLAAAFPWLAIPVGRPLAHYAAGVHDVWIGPPRRFNAPGVEARRAFAPLSPATLPAATSQVVRGLSKNLAVLACAAAGYRLAPHKTSRREPSRARFTTTKEVV